VGDAQVAPTPDGSGVYYSDEQRDRLFQLRYGPDGFTTEKIYREGVDGTGLLKPRGVVLSPDGRNLYVPSAERPDNHGGRIAVFKREPATNRLTFVSVFEGPVFNGRPPGDGPAPELTINDGDAYTNDPDVEIVLENVTDGPAFFGFEVSNDGGFGEGTVTYDVVDPGEPYPWTLATSGPERLPKTVYARVLDGVSANVITDEIVLDERPPAVDVARLVGKRRLRLRAHDRLSGVGRMQVTRHRRKPGRWRPYKGSARVPRGHGKVFVRVRDRAGNRSRWRRAAARRKR
jgi:hypothetical protein